MYNQGTKPRSLIGLPLQFRRSEFRKAKQNMRFKRMYSMAADRTLGVQVRPNRQTERTSFQKRLSRKATRIKYFDNGTQEEFVFPTNSTDLDAKEITLLYKKRWEMELFLKWMKQHLRIKSYRETSINAVKIEIYCGNTAYCQVLLIRNKLRPHRRIYETLPILSISLPDKTL